MQPPKCEDVGVRVVPVAGDPPPGTVAFVRIPAEGSEHGAVGAVVVDDPVMVMPDGQITSMAGLLSGEVVTSPEELAAGAELTRQLGGGSFRVVQIPEPDEIKWKVDEGHVLYDEAWLDGTETTLFVDPLWFHPRREAKVCPDNTNMQCAGMPAAHGKLIRSLTLVVREGALCGKVTAEFWYCSTKAYVFEGMASGDTIHVRDAKRLRERGSFGRMKDGSSPDPRKEIEVLPLEAWRVVLKYDPQSAPVRVRVSLAGPLTQPDWNDLP